MALAEDEEEQQQLPPASDRPCAVILCSSRGVAAQSRSLRDSRSGQRSTAGPIACRKDGSIIGRFRWTLVSACRHVRSLGLAEDTQQQLVSSDQSVVHFTKSVYNPIG